MFFFLGCFKDSVLSNMTRKVSLSMFRKSVGICQEMCQRHNTTVFAVKVNTNFNYYVIVDNYSSVFARREA